MALAVAPVPTVRRQVKPVAHGPFTLPHFDAWLLERQLRFDNDVPVVLEPFQKAFLKDVFSGKSECWLVVPEGNGKTTLIALLALYHAEFRPHAAVSVAASSREQAEIMYRQAEGFVLREVNGKPGPMVELLPSAIQAAKGKRKTEMPRFLCLEGYRRINHIGGSRIQVFAADDKTGDGQIPTLGVLDELHRHRDLSLYRTWAGKLGKRGGQIVTISTAGEPYSDFELTREKIRQSATEIVRKGSFVHADSGRLVLHEWAVPEKADVTDMRTVKAANPFSGITIAMLREKYNTPTMRLDHWKRFTCNVPTRSSAAAIQEAEWAKAETKTHIPKGEPIAVGLDVAWKWDTTAAVPFLWRSPTDRVFGSAEILTPPRDGNSLDPALVEAALLRIHERNAIHTVVMDRTRAEQLASWIESEIGAVVWDWPQTNTQKVLDYERFMEALRTGRLHHSGDAGLTRHALNAIGRVLPLGDARFDRSSQTRDSGEQDRRVIDALDAAAMVHSRAVDEHSIIKKPKVKLFVGAA